MPSTPPLRPGRAGRRGCLRWLLAAAGLLALSGLIGSLALPAWRASVDRKLDANWRRSLGGASFLERYPATQDNVTVRDLETLGAAIGIEMAPPGAPGHAHPAPGAAKRFEAMKPPLKDFHAAARRSTDGTFAPPSPELAAFLESIRPGLDSIRARLEQGPPPVWARDLRAGFEAKIPNYLGPLMLQKLLILDASQQIRAGREARAAEILEASWRLGQAIADNNPGLVSQLIAQAVIRLQQPVLRSFSHAPAGWPARLVRVDLQSRMILGLQYEAFTAHRSAALDRPISEVDWGPRGQAFLRWMIWDHARRFSAIVDGLQRRDVRSFDPDAFFQECLAAYPRWQIVGRLLIPNFLDAWPRSAHAELEAELTALVLEERARLAASGPPRPFDRRPSRVKGLSWIYEDLPGATTLHLDGELRYPGPNPGPLRFTVRRVAGPE
jgi:hypothetical protein